MTKVFTISTISSMLCGTQHGANFFFAMGELLLNTIPFVPHLMGFVGFWTSLFGIWGAAALPALCLYGQ